MWFFDKPDDMDAKYFDKEVPSRYKQNEDKNRWKTCIKKLNGNKYDYNFETDEIVEMDHYDQPEMITANDNMRFSIINIIAYVLDRVVNEYMVEYCRNNHSVFKDPNDPTKEFRKCRIIAKNEFKGCNNIIAA